MAVGFEVEIMVQVNQKAVSIYILAGRDSLSTTSFCGVRLLQTDIVKDKRRATARSHSEGFQPDVHSR